MYGSDQFISGPVPPLHGARHLKLTFRQFAPEYLAYAQANKTPTSYGRDRVTVEHSLTPYFGERYLFHFTVAEVERYKQARLAAVRPSTVNKELNCLKAMLNKAVSWGYLKEHPLKGVKGLKEPPGRLRWSDIDLSRRTITLTHTKNNERRVIPITGTVAAVLKAWPRSVGTDVLFPGLNGPMVTRAFWRACRKAGVANLCLHDLRHTLASYLAMGGFSLRTIQQLLGHKDPRMTSRYAHLSADHLQQALKSLDAVLGLDNTMDTLWTPAGKM